MTHQNHNCYYMYGKHAITAALSNKARKYDEIHCVDNALEYLQKLNIPLPKNVILYDNLQSLIQKLKIPNDSVHQGLVLTVQRLTQPTFDEFIELHENETAQNNKGSILVLLDKISDPHNIGAIIRTSAAFNASAVITTEHGTPNENGVIAKAACGGLEHLPLIKVVNLSRTISELQQLGYYVIGLSSEGNLQDIEQLVKQKILTGDESKIAIVLGSEDLGLRRLVAEKCDVLAKIAMADKMESLNVSNACAIALYQCYRVILQQ